MTLYVRNASVWVTPKQIYRNNAGTWQQVQKVYARNAGVWTLQYVNVTISANTSDYNLFTATGSPTTPVTVYATINSGVQITASTNSVYAFTVGAFPAGSRVYLVNNGFIVGKGGGGLGKTDANQYLTAPSFANGGPAFNASGFAISIDNTNGVIGGGGGAGGVGGSSGGDCSCTSCGGIAIGGMDISGGGAGFGAAGLGSLDYQSNAGRYGNSYYAWGVASTTNTIGTGSKTFNDSFKSVLPVGKIVRVFESTGVAWVQGDVTSCTASTLVVNVTSTSGSGTYTKWYALLYSSPGTVSAPGASGIGGSAGASGTLGVAGATGGNGIGCGLASSAPGTGGTAGACTLGNSNITWVATGNRYGALN